MLMRLQTETVHSKDNYFEEREKNEEKSTNWFMKITPTRCNDNDGVYDEQEQKRDRCRLVSCSNTWDWLSERLWDRHVYLEGEKGEEE